MNKLNTHTVEYYTARKKKRMLTPPTIGVKLENSMVGESSQSLKTTYSMFYFYEMARISKSLERK